LEDRGADSAGVAMVGAGAAMAAGEVWAGKRRNS
jgi:glucosamine 6-phosphate synthetase-like amidotransferase/phosphosugar isomerase protein